MAKTISRLARSATAAFSASRWSCGPPVDKLRGNLGAAEYKHVVPDLVARFEVAQTPESSGAALTERIRPVMQRIPTNIHEPRTLAVVRDPLLPKLLSGG